MGSAARAPPVPEKAAPRFVRHFGEIFAEIARGGRVAEISVEWLVAKIMES
jgi:hypothetical protein